MSKVYIQESAQKGKSVFAGEKILKGTKIVEFEGPYLTWNDIQSGSHEDDHCVQIGSHTYLGPSGRADDFINHSCDPNSGLKIIYGQATLFAIKDIAKDEEVTWDYSTYMDDRSWSMQCHCGSGKCRTTIKDFVFLPKETKEKYITLGVVPLFIRSNVKYQISK